MHVIGSEDKMVSEINSNSKQIPMDNGFLMSPKVDFVFKLIFGDEKNKDLLIALLSAILRLPKEDFEGLEIINSERIREFAEDKKGILDVRVKTRLGRQIDIEIQILPTKFMPERTMFYWSKMYISQVKPGDPFMRSRNVSPSTSLISTALLSKRYILAII